MRKLLGALLVVLALSFFGVPAAMAASPAATPLAFDKDDDDKKKRRHHRHHRKHHHHRHHKHTPPPSTTTNPNS